MDFLSELSGRASSIGMDRFSRFPLSHVHFALPRPEPDAGAADGGAELGAAVTRCAAAALGGRELNLNGGPVNESAAFPCGRV